MMGSHSITWDGIWEHARPGATRLALHARRHCRRHSNVFLLGQFLIARLKTPTRSHTRACFSAGPRIGECGTGQILHLQLAARTCSTPLNLRARATAFIGCGTERLSLALRPTASTLSRVPVW